MSQGSPETDLEEWTGDQELTLLKAVVRYKPVGMHKHFRMIAIREYMLNAGVISAEDTHTSIHGIWAKLGSLYNLPKLDEREDAIVNDRAEDIGDMANYWRDYELPGGEFEAMMWDRRLAPDGTQSPEWDKQSRTGRRESTVADSDDPRSSPVEAGSGRGSVRGTRSSRRGGRLSKLQNELEQERSSRRTSKAASPADEDHVMEDADQDDEEQESEEDEEESEQDPDEEEDRRGSVRGRGRGGRRGRGKRGRRRG